MRVWALAAVLGCTHASSSGLSQGPPPPPCTPVAIEVIDESGAPLADATVQATAMYMLCGPSGLPEGCGGGNMESAPAITDARGEARVCVGEPRRAYTEQRIHSYGADAIVTYRDWPAARVPLGTERVTLGPARDAIVDVPAACAERSHVHVIARGEHAAEEIRGKPIVSAMRGWRYSLAGLGPWRYWVELGDDRSGNSALENRMCPTYIRVFDPRVDHEVELDRSDTILDFPAFAGATATLTAFRSHDPVATTTLDGAGHALVALPTTRGTAYCLRLQIADRCTITLARAGSRATPGVERDATSVCGTCD